MNLILVLTCPSFSFVDVKLRKLTHYLVQTLRIDFKENKCLCKVFRLEYSTRSDKDKVYQKFIRKAGTKFDKTLIGHPTQELADAYEKKKREFLNKLYSEIAGEMKAVQKKKVQKLFDFDDAVEMVLKNKDKYIRGKKRKYLDMHLIQMDLNVSRPKAIKVKRKAEMKLKLND